MTSDTHPRDGLSALLDGELDDAALAALERELDADDALRAELEELRGVAEGVRALGDVQAPSGFLAGVMGRIDRGEGLDEPLEDVSGGPERSNVVPITAGERASAAAGSDDEVVEEELLPDNVRRLPWWVKGPVLSAVAALLIVGVGVIVRDRGPSAPPAAYEVAMRAPSSEGVAAPVPTGVIASDEDLDAVAEVGDSLDKAEVAERIRMTPGGTDRVAVGGAGTGPAVPTPPRRSGIREADGASPPPGIVAVAEAEYAPEAAADDGVAMADELSADAPEDVDHEVEEAEPGLMPAKPSSSSMTLARRGESASAAPRAAAAPAAEPVRDAMTAVASLRTFDVDAVAALRNAAQRRGWTLSFVSPSDAAVTLSDAQPEQVVELLLKPGDEPAAQRVLDGLGDFQFASTPEVGDGQRSRLRITVIFAP